MIDERLTSCSTPYLLARGREHALVRLDHAAPLACPRPVDHRHPELTHPVDVGRPATFPSASCFPGTGSERSAVIELVRQQRRLGHVGLGDREQQHAQLLGREVAEAEHPLERHTLGNWATGRIERPALSSGAASRDCAHSAHGYPASGEDGRCRNILYPASCAPCSEPASGVTNAGRARAQRERRPLH